MYFHGCGDSRASMLIRQLVDNHDPMYGVGSMTCSIYDTAWVALIKKTTNGQSRWLFPSSFQYLLEHQEHDGGWYTTSTDTDSILNTMAALLALCQHISQPLQLGEKLEDLEHRRLRATYFLETKLSSTSLRSDSHVLISKLLQLLEKESIFFDFPDRNQLMRTVQIKKQNKGLDALYGNKRTMEIGFLEGRVGEIDFNRVSHHKVSGSMMASPASTAAYLMHCSPWDAEAEAYLSNIVSIDKGQSLGGVPTKFPTTVFEVTSSIVVLLGNGFTPVDLDVRSLDKAAGFLQDCLRLESGVTGFAPYMEPDADNTAKTISALCLLGRNVSPEGLFSRYETREYFKTYAQDRNPSFRTNCLVLKAMLDLIATGSIYEAQIEKLTTFICNCWWTTNGCIEDLSNVSPNYSIMLMVEVFMRLIGCWKKGIIPVPNEPMIQDKVFISLFQALTRILQAQKTDGSWDSGGCEATAYGVISLAKLMTLSSAPRIKLEVGQAIEKGRRYLSKNFRPLSQADHVWSGKVTSGSSVLFQAYVWAALKAPMSNQPTRLNVESHFKIPLAKIAILTKYYARQAWFANSPEWLIQACLIESCLFLPQVKDVRYAVFPSDCLVEDQYFESAPFAWIAASHNNNRLIGAEFLYQMIIVTILGRQVQEYMNNIVSETFAGCLFEVEDIICDIFQEIEFNSKDQCFCKGHGDDRFSAGTTISDIRSVLYRFIAHMLNHPYVLMASSQDQAQLRSDLLSFLLSRVGLLARHDRFSSSRLSQETFADQTSHPYVFAFLACLVGNQTTSSGVGLRRDFLDTSEQKYLSAQLCRHISVISFMSGNSGDQQISKATKSRSDSSSSTWYPSLRSVSPVSTTSSSYGSESMFPTSPVSSKSSLSSSSPTNASFTKPIFTQASTALSAPFDSSEDCSQLARLITHERKCLGLSLEGLQEAGISQRTADIIKLFVDATDISERIYRDPNIGNSERPTTEDEVFDQACKLRPPPVPEKGSRGSVAAARAALTIPPLMPKTAPQHQSLAKGNDQTYHQAHTQLDASPAPMGKDESWTRTSSTPLRGDSHIPQDVNRSEQIVNDTLGSKITHAAAATPRTCTPDKQLNHTGSLVSEQDKVYKSLNLSSGRTTRASRETNRIEQIMDDIDGIIISCKHRTDNTRRAASEGDAEWAQPKLKIDAQRRLASGNGVDADAIKLAKERVETQKRADYEAHRKIVDNYKAKVAADISAQPRVHNEHKSKSMVDLSKPTTQRRASCHEYSGWVKAPPAAKEEMPSPEIQAGKLQRASRLGGPKWKAPF